MLAIREACRTLGTLDLSGCELYATLEPCPMCFGASHWAGVGRIVYGARRDDALRHGLGQDSIPVQTMHRLSGSRAELIGDVLREDNVKVLAAWSAAARRAASAADTAAAEATQYDGIAGQFQAATTSPANRHVVHHTLYELIGDRDRGSRVLDLACGEGHGCRTLARRGAARVLGVDISAGMIELARGEEARAPLGVEYLCRDVLALGRVGEFDLVVASFLLNYAKSEDELVAMCRAAYDNLRPGGDFILINENVTQSPRDFHGYERYGYAKSISPPGDEGSVITYTMTAGAEPFSFQGYYWRQETCARAFTAAGFEPPQWEPLRCSPEGIREYGERYWRNFIDNPPFIGIVAHKPAPGR
jgi:2-polyprenyl-3-methyl-5-hydroxy-6-metoxy-1,4-benzoquinol methylase